MFISKLIFIPLLFILGTVNAADISNMTVQSNNHTSISTSTNTSNSNWKKSPKPTATNSKIDWSDMPSGAKCGDYVMSGNTTRVNVYCMGQSVRNGCPKGFTHRNFGYFEAGGGERKYVWCTKN